MPSVQRAVRLCSCFGSSRCLGFHRRDHWPAIGEVVIASAVKATAQTVETFYIATVAESSAEQTTLHTGDIVLFSSVALLLALFAAAVPAWNAATVDPITMIRGNSSRTFERQRYRYLLGAALVLALIGIGLTRLGPLHGRPVFGFVAAGGLPCLSAALCTPFV